jgi:CheY-like chemotaxis protein
VRDTGIGITADQQVRIFNMFTQGDTALERSVTGLGLGLTLVKTLTEMHGGTVDVTSAGIGQGSEFIVRLPMMVQHAVVPSPAQTREPALTAKGLRILIVDDNRDCAEMLAILLSFSGHETHMAHDGVEAVDATTTLQPDVILLDIGLPRLNGYDAARKIRAQQEQPGRPFLVALTGWGQDDDRRRTEEAGFDAHLVKPVDEAALCKLLDDVGASRHQVGSSVPALQHTSADTDFARPGRFGPM